MSNIDITGSASQRRAKTASLKAAAKQRKLIAVQKQREKLRLAEEEDEIARRRSFITSSGGRASLIATSPKGITNKLGGTS